MKKRKHRLERLRGVLGLSAVGMTYDEMTRYLGVGSRQRVQQLEVEAVERFPELARRLMVTGRRHRGRRPKQDHDVEVPRVANTRKPGTPRPSVQARHLATAWQLLSQHGGRYPGATEMLRLGHGALYQFKRKYPHEFQKLIADRQAVLEQMHRKRRRKRR